MANQKNVLFVCTGNTCRSPMAEGLFRKLIADEETIQCLGSAGVAAYPGDRISPETDAILKKHGAELTSFRSRPVDEAMLQEATHVFAMTLSHLEMLVSAFPAYQDKCYLVCDFIEINGEQGADVPDPIGRGPKAYAMVANVFQHALPAIVKFLKMDNDMPDGEQKDEQTS